MEAKASALRAKFPKGTAKGNFKISAASLPTTVEVFEDGDATRSSSSSSFLGRVFVTGKRLTRVNSCSRTLAQYCAAHDIPRASPLSADITSIQVTFELQRKAPVWGWVADLATIAAQFGALISRWGSWPSYKMTCETIRVETISFRLGWLASGVGCWADGTGEDDG
ncbi:hypothetical protein BC826DRAFT_967725 [Russula brevipes]|nr:hypothetical protein BC826DRAFT_967725 [Russula brevipes]